MSARRVLAGLLLAGLLSGCGMKGDLVLPDREAPPPPPAPAAPAKSER